MDAGNALLSDLAITHLRCWWCCCLAKPAHAQCANLPIFPSLSMLTRQKVSTYVGSSKKTQDLRYFAEMILQVLVRYLPGISQTVLWIFRYLLRYYTEATSFSEFYTSASQPPSTNVKLSGLSIFGFASQSILAILKLPLLLPSLALICWLPY